jgi:hypothetical protein
MNARERVYGRNEETKVRKKQGEGINKERD